MAQVGRRPPALHLARGATRLGERLADRPTAPPVGHGDERVDRGRVVGEPAASECDIGSDPLADPAFDGRPARSGRQVAGWSVEPEGGIGLGDRAPPGAAAQMGEQRTVGVRAALGPQGGQAHHDAGRAEPALAGAGGAEGVTPGPALLVGQAVDRGDRAPGHPPRRRHARHARGAVDQHRAAAALALGAAAVLGRARA